MLLVTVTPPVAAGATAGVTAVVGPPAAVLVCGVLVVTSLSRIETTWPNNEVMVPWTAATVVPFN